MAGSILACSHASRSSQHVRPSEVHTGLDSPHSLSSARPPLTIQLPSDCSCYAMTAEFGWLGLVRQSWSGTLVALGAGCDEVSICSNESPSLSNGQHVDNDMKVPPN